MRMLVDFMTLIWQFNRNALCRDRIEETDRLAAARHEGRGRASPSSLDADSEGEEGKYYLWSEAGDRRRPDRHLRRSVQDGLRRHAATAISRARTFCSASARPRRIRSPEADEALLASQRELLLARAQKRVPPMRDDKVLADWNGMVIAALANAGAVFQKAEWIDGRDHGVRFRRQGAGRRRPALSFLAQRQARRTRASPTTTRIWRARRWRSGKSTGEKRFLDQAKRWVRTLNEHFWDDANGGYFFTADDADPLIVRARMCSTSPAVRQRHDAGVLARLHHGHRATATMRDRANACSQAFAGEAARASSRMGSFFNGLEIAMTGCRSSSSGRSNNPKTHELIAAVLGRSLPNRLLMVVVAGRGAAAGPSGATARRCRTASPRPMSASATCSAPITNPVTLTQVLQLPVRPQSPVPRRNRAAPSNRRRLPAMLQAQPSAVASPSDNIRRRAMAATVVQIKGAFACALLTTAFMALSACAERHADRGL